MPQQVRSVRGLGRQCYSCTVPRLELSYVTGTRSQVWAYGGHTNLSWPLEDLHLAYKEAFQQHAAVGVTMLNSPSCCYIDISSPFPRSET